MNSGDSLFKNVFETFPSGLLVLKLDDPDDPTSIRQIEANDAVSSITGMNMKAYSGKLWKKACPQLAESELTDVIRKTVFTGGLNEWKTGTEDSLKPGYQFTGSAWLVSKQTVVVTFNKPPGLKSSKKPMESGYTRQTAQLKSAVVELDAFTYSVSHDLRAPLRRLDGFSQELLTSYHDQLDDTGKHYLSRIRAAAQKMGSLIDDLLKLSKISRRNMEKEHFDLGALATELIQEMREEEPERKVEFQTEGNLEVYGDPGLFRSLMQNLLSNAWKFSSNQNPAHIEVGSRVLNDQRTYYIRDDGVGFDMKYADKLFRAFQRLHSEKQFEGTGIGLATVQRIINRHGGTIWAESEPGKGTTFYFKLNETNGEEH